MKLSTAIEHLEAAVLTDLVGEKGECGQPRRMAMLRREEGVLGVEFMAYDSFRELKTSASNGEYPKRGVFKISSEKKTLSAVFFAE